MRDAGGGAFFIPGVESVVSVVQVSATSLSGRRRTSAVGTQAFVRLMYSELSVILAKEFLFVTRVVMSAIGVGLLLLC